MKRYTVTGIQLVVEAKSKKEALQKAKRYINIWNRDIIPCPDVANELYLKIENTSV